MDLRKPFWNTILEMAKADKDIVLLTGDLGYSFMEKFQEELPNQILNCGIAEMNMVGMAAGMALAGKKPYVYSNAIFLLSRAHEFVRDDVAYNNTNVKLIGTKAGNFLGFSHNLGENESSECWLRGMPNIKQFTPQSEEELGEVLITNGPSFIQL